MRGERLTPSQEGGGRKATGPETSGLGAMLVSTGCLGPGELALSPIVNEGLVPGTTLRGQGHSSEQRKKLGSNDNWPKIKNMIQDKRKNP